MILSSPLNLGIVAHVDAGKTSLTERLLFETGVLDALGSVDDGNTRADSLELERRRGITIRASVTTFGWNDLTVSLVDTPGHPDFIAEVERSLAVLDAAVLVISAVEAVQPQTVAIWRALQRVGVPALIFVNKVDRAGADIDSVTEQVRQRLTNRLVVLANATGQGTTAARVHATLLEDESVLLAVAEADEQVFARWASDEPVPVPEMLHAARRGVADGRLTPLLCGSAVSGAGADVLLGTLEWLVDHRSASDNSPPAATCFAIDRDDRGRRAWLRMWSGELGVRDRVTVGDDHARPVTELAASEPGGMRTVSRVGAGAIVAVRGISPQIGDTIGTPPQRRSHSFPPAVLHALVEPVDQSQRTTMFSGLTELADEDPLIGLRTNTTDGEAEVSLHGEVQKEVIAALLEERHGVQVRFSDSSIICIERVIGCGSAQDRIKEHGNPYLAGIGLRVEPLPTGTGFRFDPANETGHLPSAFVTATEAGVRDGIREGLHGWEVTDCLVTMTSSQYYPRQSARHQGFSKAMSSTAADFRSLAPVVLMAAILRARTRVCWPVHRFELELPDDTVAYVAPRFGPLGAMVLTSTAASGRTVITGHLPARAVPELARDLPDITGGEGMLLTRLNHHAPAPLDDGKPPTRRRTGWDPRERETWFLHTPR